MTEHKQSDILRGIADGRQGQIKNCIGKWEDADSYEVLGCMSKGRPVRIKPEPTPCSFAPHWPLPPFR